MSQRYNSSSGNPSDLRYSRRAVILDKNITKTKASEVHTYSLSLSTSKEKERLVIHAHIDHLLILLPHLSIGLYGGHGLSFQ